MRDRILIVDDDEDIRKLLEAYLRKKGFDAQSVADGVGMREALAARPASLVVLDLMLPGEDGLSLTRWLRLNHDVAIIMVTAAGEVVDRVVGLEVGADDYVTKPFGMQELLARVRALLRRAETSPSPEADLITSGDLRIDLTRREISRGDKPLPLKPKEFDVLLYFVRNRGRALTREQLLNQIWGYEFAGDTRTVDVHIRWLRQKIEDDAANPVRLITVRGTGYRFEG